ncbi:MAG TPA: DUF6636 domain-containing protein [Gaiellaceae bacterium]|jgi:hypothetical protein
MAILVAVVLGISTPSGNIKCFALGGTLHCDIASASYRPDLQRRCQTRASLDWHGFELSARERGTPSCSGGALATVRTRPLAYGRTWHSGAITCTSRVTGLTCTARGHGIFISRASWRGW